MVIKTIDDINFSNFLKVKASNSPLNRYVLRGMIRIKRDILINQLKHIQSNLFKKFTIETELEILSLWDSIAYKRR
jgi:hypothetical protein